MSKDARSTTNGLRVAEAPPSRRGFVKRVALASLGAAAAVPALRPGAARAAGTNPAYTDAQNTFTANQRFDGRLGVGTDAAFPLHVQRLNDPGWAVGIFSDWNALVVGHAGELSANGTNPHDLVDLFLRSTGDAIFAAHQGGVVPTFSFTADTTSGSTTLSSVSSFRGLVKGTKIAGSGIADGATIASTNPGAGTLVISLPATSTASAATVTVTQPPGSSGGNALFNGLVPYYLDDAGTGRNGKIVNNRVGQVGLTLDTQPPNDGVTGIRLKHSGNGPALAITNQDPAYPQGAGRAIAIVDYSKDLTVDILKGTAPTGNKPIFRISTPGIGPSPVDGLRINDSSGFGRVLARTDGTLVLGLDYPTHGPTGTRLEVNVDGAGIQRNLAVSNYHATTNGDGTQIEFRMNGNQWATIQGVMDSSAPPNSSLRLRVRDATFTMVERLRVDGAGVGFFGAIPSPKPTVSGSRNGNAALADLLSGLAKLGLIKDSSTA